MITTREAGARAYRAKMARPVRWSQRDRKKNLIRRWIGQAMRRRERTAQDHGSDRRQTSAPGNPDNVVVLSWNQTFGRAP